MAKYRAEFQNKTLIAVTPTGTETPIANNFDSELTGTILEAIIDAKDDNEAAEKAKRLEIELQTGKTKENLT